uniref:Uncharacterized protein n=1 Tax=Anguilla anguilla TaxID=7936 RepID=A0A0E9V000_ANGAN
MSEVSPQAFFSVCSLKPDTPVNSQCFCEGPK